MNITVVIPVYNGEKFIGKAIDSVLNQSYLPYEIIVVDDGSNDGTYQFVKLNYPDIIIVKQFNQGPSSARNFGVREATGNWITFLDADDQWMPNIILNYVNFLLNKSDLRWCCTPYLIENQNSKRHIIYNGSQLKNDIIDNVFLAYKDFKFKVVAELISSCSVIIHKEIFEKVGLFDCNLKRGEDIDFWFRIALHYPKIGYTKEIGFKYLDINSDSITKTEQEVENIKFQIFRINKTWSYNEQKVIPNPYAKHVLNNWCFRVLKSIVKKKQMEFVKLFSDGVTQNLNRRNKIIISSINFFRKKIKI